MNYLLLFILGAIEYILAATWTHYFVTKQAIKTGLVTFISASLWGLVISKVVVGDPYLIAVHAIGCALGAAGVCAFLREKSDHEDSNRRHLDLPGNS